MNTGWDDQIGLDLNRCRPGIGAAVQQLGLILDRFAGLDGVGGHPLAVGHDRRVEAVLPAREEVGVHVALAAQLSADDVAAGPQRGAPGALSLPQRLFEVVPAVDLVDGDGGADGQTGLVDGGGYGDGRAAARVRGQRQAAAALFEGVDPLLLGGLAHERVDEQLALRGHARAVQKGGARGERLAEHDEHGDEALHGGAALRRERRTERRGLCRLRRAPGERGAFIFTAGAGDGAARKKARRAAARLTAARIAERGGGVSAARARGGARRARGGAFDGGAPRRRKQGRRACAALCARARARVTARACGRRRNTARRGWAPRAAWRRRSL
ncbi:non-ribosomal peptide synthetase [Gracilaria domingensis]|nr:non-ribosomal peptide synthetase [Gracilaria domingensis]